MLWGKKKPPSPPPPPVDPYLLLQPRLKELLEGHGVSCTTYEHWVLPNNDLPALRAFPYLPNEFEDGSTTLQIDIELRLKKDLTIVESYGGMGEGIAGATNNVLMTFCVGTMHAYLSAFWDKHEPDQVDIETWEVNGHRWSAYMAATIFKMSKGVLQPKLPDGYLQTIQDHVASLALEGDYHWISAFLMRLDDALTPEVQIDNLLSPDLTEKMKTLAWPTVGGFYSVRSFVLLKRQPAD